MSRPFSIKDAPYKNLRDGLLVCVLALGLLFYNAGSWVDLFFVFLFGPFVCAGLIMIVIGCARAALFGWRGQRESPPRLLAFWNGLVGGVVRYHRVATDANETLPAVPVWLALSWLGSVLVGPLLGWLMTLQVFVPLTEDNWQFLCSGRFVFACLFPTFFGLLLALRYYFPYSVRRWYGGLFLFCSALAAASGWQPGQDVIAGLRHERVVIEAWRPRGYLLAPWYSSQRFVELDKGLYEARMADGRQVDFQCPPICLGFRELDGVTWQVGGPVDMVWLEHLRVIVALE